MEPVALSSVDYRRLLALARMEQSRREEHRQVESVAYYGELAEKLSCLGSGAAEAEARRDRYNGRNFSHTQ